MLKEMVITICKIFILTHQNNQFLISGISEDIVENYTFWGSGQFEEKTNIIASKLCTVLSKKAFISPLKIKPYKN